MKSIHTPASQNKDRNGKSARVILASALAVIGFIWLVDLRALPAANVPAQAIGLLFLVNSTADGSDSSAGDGVCETVTTGECTLRAAIEEANALPGDDGIRFGIPLTDPNCNAGAGPCTITLGSALPDLSLPINITGPGARSVIVRRLVSATTQYSIFNVTTNGTVNISALTISEGTVGGVRNAGGTLNVRACTISNNRARFGGGIYNENGTLMVINSTISDNHTAGIGAHTFNATGGGIYNGANGTASVINSTLYGNAANGHPDLQPNPALGGGIYNLGTLNVTNSTVSGNYAAQDPANPLPGPDVEHYGGGIYNDTRDAVIKGVVNLKNTVVAGNTALTAGNDVYGPINSAGYNLIKDTSGATITPAQATDIFGQDPLLGPLQNNGGPTNTMELQTGSPAIDQATSDGLTGPLTTDQRGTGFLRTSDDGATTNATGGDGTDIGAFEIQFPPPTPTPTATPTPTPTSQVGPPTSKEDCKNGGWQNFNTPRTFTNQGDCQKFVKNGI